MFKNKSVQYKAVETKREVIEFLRDEEVRVLKLKSEYTISDADLLEGISEDPRSPRLIDVLYNMVDEDEIFQGVDRIEYSEVVKVIVRVVRDGLVYYKQSTDGITIYELGDLHGEIEPMDVDELYIPDLYELSEAFDELVKFEEVLREINWRSKHKYDGYDNLYLDVIDDERYGYVKRYCRSNYSLFN